MKSKEQPILGRMKSLRKQDALLLRLYQAELAKDPTSLGAASSRSNLMALRHTVALMFGDQEQIE